MLQRGHLRSWRPEVGLRSSKFFAILGISTSAELRLHGWRPKLGALLGSPYDKDHRMLGVFTEAPEFWKLPCGPWRLLLAATIWLFPEIGGALVGVLTR